MSSDIETAGNATVPRTESTGSERYSSKMNSLFALGRWNELMDCALMAIEVDQDNEEGYIYAGIACCQIGKYDDAEQYFSKALERNPNNYVTYLNMAYLYSLLGDMQKAETMQRRGEELQMLQEKVE